MSLAAKKSTAARAGLIKSWSMMITIMTEPILSPPKLLMELYIVNIVSDIKTRITNSMALMNKIYL
jgi:hypothetical protein